jgi:hypothetical protein
LQIPKFQPQQARQQPQQRDFLLRIRFQMLRMVLQIRALKMPIESAG